MAEDPTSATFEQMREFAETIPHSAALGIQVLELARDHCLYRIPYDPRLVGNAETGVLHGGVISTLLDAASGTSVFGAIGELIRIATLDLRVDYLRPAEPGRDVMARASCYKLTRNIAFTRAVAYHDDPADPIAHAVGTFMVSGTVGAGKAKES